jgi:hypothetical protein
MTKALLIVSIAFLGVFAAPKDGIIDLLAPADGSTTPDTRSSADPLVTHASDSSIPKPIIFAWSPQGGVAPFAYSVFLSETPQPGASGVWLKDLPDTFASVWNLKIDTRYYWMISGSDAEGRAWISPIGSFQTCPNWPRMLYIDGSTNVRDIGGRATAEGRMIPQGIFFRSAEFNTGYVATEKGMAELMRLGIVCEIDLRKPEDNPHPTFPPSVRYVNPVNDSGWGINQYKDGLIQVPELYAWVFHEIAKPQNYPMSCHCRAGADRTGTVVAMLEAIVGCSEQQMGEDYQWSSLSIFDLRDTILDQWKGSMSYLKSFDGQNGNIQAGTCNYLLKQGVTVAELISIRKIFVGDDTLPFPVGVYGPPPRSDGRLAAASFPMVRKLCVSFPLTFIFLPKGTTGAVLYTCRGAKQWHYRGPCLSIDRMITLPGVPAGAYVLQVVK